MARTISSFAENAAVIPPSASSTNLAIFRTDAPSITGIARKNENSAAAFLDTPRIVEPIMV